jgi:hypothetical protein
LNQGLCIDIDEDRLHQAMKHVLFSFSPHHNLQHRSATYDNRSKQHVNDYEELWESVPEDQCNPFEALDVPLYTEERNDHYRKNDPGLDFLLTLHKKTTSTSTATATLPSSRTS